MSKYALSMRALIMGTVFTCLSAVLVAQSEAVYVYEINTELSGETEVVVPSGRVDIVTDTHAYEVEMANNWKEAIGQALWYGLQTERQAGIILIKEVPADFKFIQQLQSALDYAGLTRQIQVLVYPDDFLLASTVHEYAPPPTVLRALEENDSSDEVKGKTDYWLTKNSKKRHNKDCPVYETSRGRYCDPSEGVAAGCCGG